MRKSRHVKALPLEMDSVCCSQRSNLHMLNTMERKYARARNVQPDDNQVKDAANEAGESLSTQSIRSIKKQRSNDSSKS